MGLSREEFNSHLREMRDFLAADDIVQLHGGKRSSLSLSPWLKVETQWAWAFCEEQKGETLKRPIGIIWGDFDHGVVRIDIFLQGRIRAACHPRTNVILGALKHYGRRRIVARMLKEYETRLFVQELP